MRRKGELSPNMVDRDWPHQIMVPAEDVMLGNYDRAQAFCADLSLAPRGHSIFKDDKWHRVFALPSESTPSASRQSSAESGSIQRRADAVATGRRSNRRSSVTCSPSCPRL